MYQALLIEDDREAAKLTQRILSDRGFVSDLIVAADEIERIELGRGVYDLIVVDRRLPAARTSEPLDTVGDDLLERLLETEVDVPFVVFTGYSDKLHMQAATQDKGSIQLQGISGGPVDRCYVYEKIQTNEFAERVARIRDLLLEMERVDVQGVEGQNRDAHITRRLLARVGLTHGGLVVHASAFSGGLTAASVWKCEVYDSRGVRTAVVVVKISAAAARGSGGLSGNLPAALVAGRTERLEGLSGGMMAEVFQLASAQATTLLQELASDPDAAAAHIIEFSTSVTEHVPATKAAFSLEEVIAPLVSWSKIESISDAEGLVIPNSRLVVGHSMGAQHGDLHPGNLIADGSRCVVIDFDSEVVGSVLLDPVALMLGAIFNRGSHLRRTEWPTEAHFRAFYGPKFLEASPCPDWFEACWRWIQSYGPGERELWSVVYGYAMRQLKYEDVLKHVRLHAGARTLAELALGHLN